MQSLLPSIDPAEWSIDVIDRKERIDVCDVVWKAPPNLHAPLLSPCFGPRKSLKGYEAMTRLYTTGELLPSANSFFNKELQPSSRRQWECLKDLSSHLRRGTNVIGILLST
jgi:hypothetical protein